MTCRDHELPVYIVSLSLFLHLRYIMPSIGFPPFSTNFRDFHIGVHAFMDIHLSFAMTPATGERVRPSNADGRVRFALKPTYLPVFLSAFPVSFLFLLFSSFVRKETFLCERTPRYT